MTPSWQDTGVPGRPECRIPLPEGPSLDSRRPRNKNSDPREHGRYRGRRKGDHSASRTQGFPVTHSEGAQARQNMKGTWVSPLPEPGSREREMVYISEGRYQEGVQENRAWVVLPPLPL